jgi:Cu(I)/Ag(I) efflux system membrane fusion protein
MTIRAIARWRNLFLMLGVLFILSLSSCAKRDSDDTRSARAVKKETTQSQALYYCPMHPTYTSDKPGDCPICGMKLVKAEAAAEPQEVMQMPPGEVMISPEKQQLIGLTTAQVEYRDLTQTIRTVGKVEYNEKGLGQVSARIGGRIDRLFVNFTGAEVKKGQPLLELYSPELVSAQEEYLLAREIPGATGPSPAEAARRKLLLWGITESQLEELDRTKQGLAHLTIHSPQAGVVTSKNVKEGMYVDEGMALFDIADLSTVWIYGDFYEYEISLLRVGQRAKVSLSYYPGESFTGTVSFIFPYLESETRTVRARIEIPNAARRLKPGMYANVELRIDRGRKLAVPDDAVLDSGTRQVVFLDRGEGRFLPKEVELGPKVEGYYQVLSGLEAGDRVVTAANFLVDSESNLKAALEGMAGMPGMEHERGKGTEAGTGGLEKKGSMEGMPGM